MNQDFRLNKFLALHIGISRREADELIIQKRIRINDDIANIGARVHANDQVFCDGKKIENNTQYTYIMLNKPAGYVCSRKQQGESPTIYSLIPNEFHSLKTIGRLDRDSSGLIILTNDGDYAQTMTHPKFRKNKQYEVLVDQPLQPLHHQMISDFGIELSDGQSKLQLERTSDDRKQWRITMHEGRNRQIRRTFAALGYKVTRLHRTQFGPYALESLQAGTYKSIDKK